MEIIGSDSYEQLLDIKYKSPLKVILFFQFTSIQSESKTLVDDECYRIIGLPFYNYEITKDEVADRLRDL